MREIKPVNNNGSIQLKFSFGGKRYSFNPIPGGHFGNRRDLFTASAIANKIQNDILSGHFDSTLNSYRLSPKPYAKPKKLLDLWDLWVDSLELTESTKANHYRWTRVMITKTNPGLEDIQWLTKSEISPKTFRTRLSMLKACCKWAVSRGIILSNPYDTIKPRKDKPKEIKPFTLSEIKAILEGFDTLEPHYSPFVRFLLATGVRTSEAIGLTWGNIDFDRADITIKESLPKDLTGNGYRRIRKETKTGNIRHLPLSLELQAVLSFINLAKVTPDSLVFTTPKGRPIDADNFRNRQWASVLKAQGVPYRKPYTMRHTMISHAIEQGIPLTGIAYLAGHSDTSMVIKTYGHMINRPDLPTLPI
ncbi:MAG: site-specific integrase [Trichormus sp. ATA11-4-KO1]|jgi:integrase|nr:site-specific integrase [Trichormus sp. ATA11-4-KO1]